MTNLMIKSRHMEMKCRHMETVYYNWRMKAWSVDTCSWGVDTWNQCFKEIARNLSKLQKQISWATEIQIQKSLSLSSRSGSQLSNETNFMTKLKVLEKLWSKEWCSIFGNSTKNVRYNYLHIYKIKLRKKFNINYIPEGLVSTATNGVQKF